MSKCIKLKANLVQLPEVPELGSDNKEMIRGLVYKADDEDVESWSLLAQFWYLC